jgi:hypothetical protein
MLFSNVKTELCQIMTAHGSDKGNHTHHNYTTLYHDLFSSKRMQPLRVFELGIGTNNINIPSNMGANGTPGASLRGWAEYFPNAKIFGADIDRNILFTEDRIETYYCDQKNPLSIELMWMQPSLKDPFDIIIEDGLHEFDANVTFFENSISKLKNDAYYIIEDVLIHTLPVYHAKINEWKIKYPHLTFTIVTHQPPSNNNADNCVIVVH